MRNVALARVFVTAAALVYGFAQPATHAAANIVVNSGFETGTFSGWTLSGSTVFTSISGGASAQSGKFGVLTGPFGSWGFLSQTLATVPGTAYQLEYWLTNHHSGPNAFQVSWGGAVVGTRLTNVTAFGYTRFVVADLVATSTSTLLTFGFQHEPSFFSLDNVSVTANELLTDIAILTATTPDAKRVDFTYAISGGTISPFEVSVYRSSDDRFDRTTDILVGSTIITDGTPGSASVVGDLGIDPNRPFVLVVADPSNALQETDEHNNTRSFRKRVVGIVTPGSNLVGNLPSAAGVPGWVGEMTGALERHGYDRTIGFDWSAYSNAVLPGQTATAAILLGSAIQSAIQMMNPRPTDVIDTHYIGHSRGAVVNGQALQRLSQNGTLPESMARGWIKMTMLDPHPARNGASGPLCSFDSESQLGWLLFIGCAAFQAVTQDPDAAFPSRVNQSEVYFQHTPSVAAPSWQRFLNLWGVGDILPNSHDWTHAGIGHAEIPEAYRISEFESQSSASSASGAAIASVSAPPDGSTDEIDRLFPEYVDNRGLARGLIAKLATARAALERGETMAARGALSAFVNEVHAQRAAHINAEAADLFVAAANSILSELR